MLISIPTSHRENRIYEERNINNNSNNIDSHTYRSVYFENQNRKKNCVYLQWQQKAFNEEWNSYCELKKDPKYFIHM